MRLYIGIDLPGHIKKFLSEIQLKLEKLGVEGKWKSPEYLHITLEFFGELPSETISSLARIIEDVLSDKEAFKLSVNRLGAFSSFKRAHTLWAGVGGSTNKLEKIWSELHLELEKNGFVLQKLSFRPHITLLSRPKKIEADLASFSLGKPKSFIVSEIILFESKVEEGKRIYPALYRMNLKR